MKQRSIRKKALLSFDEEEGEEEGLGMARPPAAVKAAAAQRPKERKPAGKALLSFGDDEAGGEALAAGKKKGAGAAASGRARPSLHVAPPPPGVGVAGGDGPTAFTSGAGEYTAERLGELRKNARSFPGGGGGTGGSAPPGGLTAPGGFTLAGSFKRAAPPKDDRFQYDVRAAGVVRPAPHKGGEQLLPPPSEQPPPPPPPPDAAAAAPPPPPGPPPPEEEDLDIPDEEMIKWAKAKRERLRAAHLAPDYLPLQGGGAGLGARLRDKKAADEAAGAGAGPIESGSDEEAEDDMRLKFMGKAPPTQGEMGEGEGEEEDQWAQEQIRKGMGGLLRPEAAPASGRGGTAGPGRPLAAGAEPQAQGGAGARTGAGGGASQAAAVAAAAAEVLKSLEAGVGRQQASQLQAEKNLARTTQHLKDSLASVTRLEAELAAAGEKYTYVQRLRAYIADLCNMLADKSPLVEELEEQQQAMQQERAERQHERARGDDEEAFAPAEAAVSAVLGVLSRGGAPAAAAVAGEAAAAAAEAQQLGSNLPVELDEFGRDMNAERKMAAATRARRRAARLAEAQRRLAVGPAAAAGQPPAGEERLGEESSEESEGEDDHYKSRQAEIQEAAAAVFRDAADEYATLGAIKAQLEEWKAEQLGTYRDAYVSLRRATPLGGWGAGGMAADGVGAPAIFAPFVRLELLSWQPLHGGATGFDSQAWYRQLFEFGQPDDPSQADPEDPDNDLIPQLVGKIVLPLARHLLAEVWRPTSRRQSAAAAAVLSDLLVYLPPDDQGLQETFQLVHTRLAAAVDATVLPPWPPAALAACPRAAVLLAERFGRGVRLLQAACSFAAVLPRGPLQKLALERLLAQQLLPYARSAAGNLPVAADRAARLAAALRADWFPPGVPPPRGTEGLLELLGSLARAAQASAGGVAGRAAAGQAVARQLSAALVQLGDAKTGNAVAKAYGVL
eukprot:scaffold20.g7831.t1